MPRRRGRVSKNTPEPCRTGIGQVSTHLRIASSRAIAAPASPRISIELPGPHRSPPRTPRTRSGIATRRPPRRWTSSMPSDPSLDTGTAKPCVDPKTLGDELDTAARSWRYYAPVSDTISTGGIRSSYAAVRHIRHDPIGPGMSSRPRKPCSIGKTRRSS